MLILVDYGCEDMGFGIFSDEGLKNLIDENIIKLEEPLVEGQIQPSSIDLRLGSRGFCIPYSSLPIKGSLEDYFEDVAHYPLDFDRNDFLHKGKVYVVELQESLNLPEYFAARSNPKSSIGRTDIHVRMVTDRGEVFDNVPYGYKGKLWLEIIPHSFDIKLKRGISLNQLRVFDVGIKNLIDDELKCAHREEGLVFEKVRGKKKKIKELSLEEGVVYMSINLKGNLAGYVARADAPPVDLLRKDHPASKYFNEIKAIDGELVVQRNLFYILNTVEIFNIPTDSCGEMCDIKTELGEIRAHYAGFFDPGFCAQAVAELRNLGDPFLLKHGQRVGGIEFFRLKSPSKVAYGAKSLKSFYQGQEGPRLAKFFDAKK